MSIKPHQAQTSAAQNSRMMVAPIATADRHGAHFHDFKRGRQERQLFAAPAGRTPEQDTRVASVGRAWRISGLHEFLPAIDATMHGGRRS
jgi:hypothetical protein